MNMIIPDKLLRFAKSERGRRSADTVMASSALKTRRDTMTLSTVKTTFVAVMILAVVVLTGCDMKAAYQQSAEQRWQKTIEQAKLDYARQYIEQGNYQHAKLLLDPLVESGRYPEAMDMMNCVQESRPQYASVTNRSSEASY